MGHGKSLIHTLKHTQRENEKFNAKLEPDRGSTDLFRFYLLLMRMSASASGTERTD